jgi:predicted CXXCH cytochrome family protein
MRGRRTALALCASAALLAACSGPSGHRVLTFFFDGVPPLGAPATADADHAPKGGGPAKPAIQVRDHGPFAAKLCEGCHETGRGNALVVPADELCAKCHTLDLSRKFVHGPLNGGGCLLCHDPHRSQYPYLLVAESGTFCVRCHDRRALRQIAGHEPAGEACAACHEAHMSDREYLLR